MCFPYPLPVRLLSPFLAFQPCFQCIFVFLTPVCFSLTPSLFAFTDWPPVYRTWWCKRLFTLSKLRVKSGFWVHIIVVTQSWYLPSIKNMISRNMYNTSACVLTKHRMCKAVHIVCNSGLYLQWMLLDFMWVERFQKQTFPISFHSFIKRKCCLKEKKKMLWT